MSFAQSLAKTLGPPPQGSAHAKELEWRRQRCSTGLGIDLLLGYAGVEDARGRYPTAGRDELPKLVEAIEAGGRGRVHQSRALLYLLLDFSGAGGSGGQAGNAGGNSGEANSGEPTSGDALTVAAYYASQVWMSGPEQSLVRALWLLDHGQAPAALELLGAPYSLEGADLLDDYVVAALADQRPGAVAGFLAGRGPSPGSYAVLVKSLALKGKFAEVLDIARSQQSTQFLKEMTRAAVGDKQTALTLTQLPCTAAEWRVVKEELEHIVLTASPSQGDVNAMTALAKDILLVRALHTGDTRTLHELRGSSEAADLLIQNATAA